MRIDQEKNMQDYQKEIKKISKRRKTVTKTITAMEMPVTVMPKGMTSGHMGESSVAQCMLVHVPAGHKFSFYCEMPDPKAK